MTFSPHLWVDQGHPLYNTNNEMTRIVNIAHRGARSLAPENTMAAAFKALAVGADMWETDVAVTRDRQLILMHDDSLARTTNAATQNPDRSPWSVSQFSLDEILLLDAGTWFVETDPFGQIAAGLVTPGELVNLICQKTPTLKEALLFTQQSHWRVNLELKAIPPSMRDFPMVDHVLAAISESKIELQRTIISSFNHDWLREILDRKLGIEVQALVGDLRSALTNPEFDTYNAWADVVDNEQIRQAIDQGIRVNLYTVNDEDDMRRYISAGVGGLFTDFPQRLKTLLAR